MQNYKLGEYIRQRRLDLGLTQEQVCAGICESVTLSRFENGKQTPSRNRINAILQRLGLPRARNAPNVFASIVLTSFGKRIAYHAPKGNRRFVYLLQNTNPPPPVRSMDRQRGIFYMELRRKMLGSELTAGGRQKPEPCRARYPRTS